MPRAKSIVQARNDRIRVDAEHATQRAVFLAEEKQIGICDDDPPARIFCPKVSSEKDLIERIARIKNREFRVVLVEFADDTKHHRFLGRRCLRSRVRQSGIVVRSDFLGIQRHRRRAFSVITSRIASLIEAAEKVCATESRKSPATTWLRRKMG